MAVNEEALAFHQAVYDETRKIPEGKVTSYGHILKLIYRPQNSRQVGISLKNLDIANSDVPWWRVVNYKGIISPRESGIQPQIKKLQDEDITVMRYSDGSHGVDLEVHGWFPETEFD